MTRKRAKVANQSDEYLVGVKINPGSPHLSVVELKRGGTKITTTLQDFEDRFCCLYAALLSSRSKEVMEQTAEGIREKMMHCWHEYRKQYQGPLN